MRSGLDSKDARVLIEAMVLHVGLIQFSGMGKRKKKETVAAMYVAIIDTKHENETNVNYVYNKLRNIEAERLQNTIVKVVEDIRS